MTLLTLACGVHFYLIRGIFVFNYFKKYAITLMPLEVHVLFYLIHGYYGYFTIYKNAKNQKIPPNPRLKT